MEKIRISANTPHPELTYIPDVAEKPPHYLREWRKHAKMTQDELADAVGTSKSVISDLERFNLQLSPKWLRRLAPVLKTQEGYLIDHDPADLDTDIIDIWSHIPDSRRAEARELLSIFARRTGTK